MSQTKWSSSRLEKTSARLIVLRAAPMQASKLTFTRANRFARRARDERRGRMRAAAGDDRARMVALDGAGDENRRAVLMMNGEGNNRKVTRVCVV